MCDVSRPSTVHTTLNIDSLMEHIKLQRDRNGQKKNDASSVILGLSLLDTAHYEDWKKNPG